MPCAVNVWFSAALVSIDVDGHAISMLSDMHTPPVDIRAPTSNMIVTRPRDLVVSFIATLMAESMAESMDESMAESMAESALETDKLKSSQEGMTYRMESPK